MNLPWSTLLNLKLKEIHFFFFVGSPPLLPPVFSPFGVPLLVSFSPFFFFLYTVVQFLIASFFFFSFIAPLLLLLRF